MNGAKWLLGFWLVILGGLLLSIGHMIKRSGERLVALGVLLEERWW